MGSKNSKKSFQLSQKPENTSNSNENGLYRSFKNLTNWNNNSSKREEDKSIKIKSDNPKDRPKEIEDTEEIFEI